MLKKNKYFLTIQLNQHNLQTGYNKEATVHIKMFIKAEFIPGMVQQMI